MADSTQNTPERESTTVYWIITVVSTIATILLLMYASEWFWVGLPFVFTYLTKATRGM